MSFSAKVRWDDSELRNRLKQATPRALFRAGSIVARVSGQQCPLDTGALLRSQAVTEDGKECYISYDTPYAVKVHEGNFNFQRHRKRKYLEDPINDPSVRDAVLKSLAADLKME